MRKYLHKLASQRRGIFENPMRAVGPAGTFNRVGLASFSHRRNALQDMFSATWQALVSAGAYE